MTTYGNTRAAPVRKGKSNRDKVQWVPVTEASFARSVLAAEIAGVDLAVWLDEAIAYHLARTRQQQRDSRYRAVCEAEVEAGRSAPTRFEWERGRQQQPFVRRQRSASENQAGRPSSRHHQNGTGAEPGSKARSGTGATHSFAPLQSEHGEDPPFEAGEHRGITSVASPPEHAGRRGPQ